MSSKITLGSRVLLGLIFTVFGLNFFFHFIPVPPPPEAGANFLGALFATGYIFPIIKTLEVITGLALIAGVFVPLSLLLLAPIAVNILLFHTILAPEGAPLAIVVVVLGLLTAWGYKDRFTGVISR